MKIKLKGSDMPDIVLPIIHLNGSGRENLVELRMNLYHALRDADDRLREMVPNGRDYYPVPGKLQHALEQHKRRATILKELANEIEIEIEAISDPSFH
jgi:hypothetical protein